MWLQAAGLSGHPDKPDPCFHNSQDADVSSQETPEEPVSLVFSSFLQFSPVSSDIAPAQWSLLEQKQSVSLLRLGRTGLLCVWSVTWSRVVAMTDPPPPFWQDVNY